MRSKTQDEMLSAVRFAIVRVCVCLCVCRQACGNGHALGWGEYVFFVCLSYAVAVDGSKTDTRHCGERQRYFAAIVV